MGSLSDMKLHGKPCSVRCMGKQWVVVCRSPHEGVCAVRQADASHASKRPWGEGGDNRTWLFSVNHRICGLDPWAEWFVAEGEGFGLRDFVRAGVQAVLLMTLECCGGQSDMFCHCAGNAALLWHLRMGGFGRTGGDMVSWGHTEAMERIYGHTRGHPGSRAG